MRTQLSQDTSYTDDTDCDRRGDRIQGGQHRKAHMRFLEHRKRALLRELAAVNRELHTTRPARVRFDEQECEL